MSTVHKRRQWGSYQGEEEYKINIIIPFLKDVYSIGEGMSR